MVKGFTFTGNTIISALELEAVVAGYIGKSIDLEELQKAVAKLTKAYHDQGLTLAKVYVPPQEVKGGVVEIAVAEGGLGKIVVEGNTNYDADFIRDHITTALREGGRVVDTKALERALLIL